jgi:excisionase family DNA binding protein
MNQKITKKEAAEIADRSEMTIQRWIDAGHIKAELIAGKWMIYTESLTEYLQPQKRNFDN